MLAAILSTTLRAWKRAGPRGLVFAASLLMSGQAFAQAKSGQAAPAAPTPTFPRDVMGHGWTEVAFLSDEQYREELAKRKSQRKTATTDGRREKQEDRSRK